MKVTEVQNEVLKKFKGKMGVTSDEIKAYLPKTEFYKKATEAELKKATEQIMSKLAVVNKEKFSVV